jgi:hypothetical protein
MLAGIGVVVLAVVLLIVLKGGSDEGGSDAGEVPTIVIQDGKPVGGVHELAYEKGDRIRFKVSSDVTDEIHVHGYDLIKDVRAGATVSFDFSARIEGLFEAELEGRKQQILELRVNP